MLTEDPLHPHFLALTPGDWIQFMLPNSIRKGEVLDRKGRSLLVQFQAHDEPTAIPDAESYFSNPVPGQFGMLRISPEKMIEAPTSHTMSVRQAAARLGVDTKTIRRMLREGALTGRQEEGRWVVDSHAIAK